MDGALVIASSLRRTEIKQILSVWSLQAFLRLLGRFREMTRGPVADTASAQHGLDRQNTLFNTKMQRHRHGGIVCVIYCHLSKLSVGQTPRLCSLPSKSLLIILMFLLRVVVIW